MSIKNNLRDRIRNFLEIKEPQGLTVNIEQLFDIEGELFKNKLWFRGNANELETFYEHVDAGHIGNRHFWSSRPTKSMNIRKIHTGLPSLIVEKLTDVCIDDLYDIRLNKRQEEWNEIAEENKFNKLLETAVSQVFALGDGAFKFSYDKEISGLPIIEFFPGDRVDFEYSRGRLTAVVFKTKHKIKDRDYTLKEHYEKNSIYYTLENKEGKDVDITEFSDFADCVDIENKAGFIAAVPVIFRPSNQFEGRGLSVYHNKIDAFDSFDEIWSQWMLAIRKGQIKTFVPEQFL
ncbi:MAG: phage portal protein, partial [Clostridia bacterium]|nr:phage portal protein [Clostridia bacterium]